MTKIHYPPIKWEENGKVTLPKIEFYINNTCNLTCNGCNRFNNFNFTGVQKWQDYEEVYSRWAQRINIHQLVIMRGEPLLNPTIVNWISGLNKLWGENIQILSNGTRLNNVKGLYEACLYGKNWIGVSIHNPLQIESIVQQARNFLHGDDFYETGNIESLVRTPGYYKIEDKNGVRVEFWSQTEFGQAAVHKDEKTGRFTLRQSDPIQTHQGCSFFQHKSYHMIQGKLYKCGPVALFPEFDQQHNLDLSKEDKKLIYSYKPLSIDEFNDTAKYFLDHIDEPLSHCKFCPEGWRHTPELIYPTIKNKLN